VHVLVKAGGTPTPWSLGRVRSLARSREPVHKLSTGLETELGLVDPYAVLV